MSKSQKQYSERKHMQVHNFLVKNFPGCEVKYNGVKGVDHQITFNNFTVCLETKTCKHTIGAGIDKVNGVRLFRHGRFKFDQGGGLPYEISQHQDLTNKDGWYIFIVGNRIRGAPARKIDERLGRSYKWEEKRVSWDKIIFICSLDWLKELKMQVYGI